MFQKSKTPVSSGMPPHEEISSTSFHSKDSEKIVFGKVNSPTPSAASRNLSVRHNTRSQSLSSSMKDTTVKVTLPRTGNTKQSQISFESDRSEIKSLDELFSKADDAEDSISSTSSGKLVLKYCLGRLGMNCTNSLLINLLINMGKYFERIQ